MLKDRFINFLNLLPNNIRGYQGLEPKLRELLIFVIVVSDGVLLTVQDLLVLEVGVTVGVLATDDVVDLVYQGSEALSELDLDLAGLAA
jgi:hypothetical protein